MNPSAVVGKLEELQKTAGVMTALQQAATTYVVNTLQRRLREAEQAEAERPDPTVLLLNHVGPAAAGAAVRYALEKVNKQSGGQKLTVNSFVKGGRLVKNDYTTNFDTSVREYLLPRYGYANFDAMVDPRHNVDYECGHPSSITPFMYHHLYNYDDTAARVNNIYCDEAWGAGPEVYETDDEEQTTPFEEDWAELCRTKLVMQNLYRLDKVSGIGHYGVLLIGLSDERDLDQPVKGVGEDGEPLPETYGPLKVLYFRPLGEYHCFIEEFERDKSSPRFGLPKFYNIVFEDVGTNPSGASVGTRENLRVHWHRVVHVAPNQLESTVYGMPRSQQVFYRLLNLRKIKGGSAEMIWRGGFPGIAFEVDPEYVADDPEFDRDAFKETVKNFSNGLQRYIDLIGVKANTLSPNIATNPDKYTRIQLESIALALATPLRIFLGSEEARLASSEDKLTWNQRVKSYISFHLEPHVIRATVDRLLLLRVLRAPAKGPGGYKVAVPDLNAPTDEDKANLALKYAQALSQYVASGMIHLIQPLDFLTIILGLRPADAIKIVKEMGPGLEKLKKVDPSQGAGVNGKNPNVAKKAGPGMSRGRPKPGTPKAP